MQAALGLSFLLALTAAACGSAAATPSPTPSAVGTPVDLSSVPLADTSLHAVPLEEVVFDTFDGSFVRLPDATDATILRLRDVIQPIYEPLYVSAEEAAAIFGVHGLRPFAICDR